MAFSLPNFNLAVDVYQAPWATRVLRLSTVGNLAFSKRVQQSWLSAGGFATQHAVQFLELLLPPLTDVRSGLLQAQADMVEVPSGSGRWYQVLTVEDIGKGFPNEHRAAGILAASQFTDSVQYPGLMWPVPMP